MPRPTLFDHPKFHRLVHVLSISEPLALGHLEFLWRVGYSSGNPVIGDAVDVEIAAKWGGEPGVLCAALVRVKLIDARKDGTFQIHHLHANAPDYVKSRYRMERYRQRCQQVNKDEQLRNGLRNRCHSPAPAPAPIDLSTRTCVEPVPPYGAKASQNDTSTLLPVKTLLTFPVVGNHGSSWAFTDIQAAKWATLFPTVDVEAEARKALAWVEAAPDRRKTPRGMPKFLVSWLTRATDRPRQAGPGPGPPVSRERSRLMEGHRLLEEHLARKGGPQ